MTFLQSEAHSFPIRPAILSPSQRQCQCRAVNYFYSSRDARNPRQRIFPCRAWAVLVIDLKRWLTNFDYRPTCALLTSSSRAKYLKLKLEFELINHCRREASRVTYSRRRSRSPSEWEMWSKFMSRLRVCFVPNATADHHHHRERYDISRASFNILLIPRNTIAPYLRGNIFVSNGLNGDNLSDAPNFSLSPGITMNK